MIDIKDLQIGDWVKNQECFCKVKSIAPDGIYFEDEFGEGVCSYDRLEPIPLTPEILEKNGFVPREDWVNGIDEALPFVYENEETTESIVIGWRDSYDNGLRDENALVLKEYWQINVDGISANYEKTASVLYVHELQHCLKLVGIEKNITL